MMLNRKGGWKKGQYDVQIKRGGWIREGSRMCK